MFYCVTECCEADCDDRAAFAKVLFIGVFRPEYMFHTTLFMFNEFMHFLAIGTTLLQHVGRE